MGIASLHWISFSAMLSTAIFDGAQHSIFECGYNLAFCSINSTMVVVLPVPGGPCINASSLELKQCMIVSFWNSLRFLLNQDLSTRFAIFWVISSNTKDGEARLHKMSLSFCWTTLVALQISYQYPYQPLSLLTASLHLWKLTLFGNFHNAM